MRRFTVMSGRASRFAAILLLAAPFLSAAAESAVLRGKVVHQGTPLAGAVVSLHADRSGDLGGAPDHVSPPTGPDGTFTMQVPPGRYFLLARAPGAAGRLRPGDFHAYYGGNPLVLGEGEELEVGVSASPVVGMGEQTLPGGTGIRGRVFSSGAPLQRARVVLYQDGSTIFRGMGYASTLTSGEGDFSFNLEPGRYYVVARKRAAEDRFGPLATGDFFAWAHDNPVTVLEGSYAVISLNAVTKLEKTRDAGADLSLGGTIRAGETTLEGVVRLADGSPAPGVFVSAHRDPMMTAKPDFISPVTGPDGRYTLNLPGGGSFFIGARSSLGGPAERGELTGRWTGSRDHSLTVATGEKRTGVDLVVERVE
jgi:hypothetical protein